MSAPQKNNEAYVLLVGVILIAITLIFSFGIPRFSQEKITDPKGEEPVYSLKDIEFISLKEANMLLGSGNLEALDLRSESDFYREHLINSINLTQNEITKYIETLRSKNETKKVILLVTYAEKSESLSVITKYFTTALPGIKVFSLSGGFEAWKNASYPTLRAGDPTNPIDQTKVEYIKSSEILTFITSKTNILTIDVRNPSDYTKDHLDITKNIPLQKLEIEKDSLSRGQTIVVFGSNALESFQAGVRLFDMGFFQVYTLDGGYDDIIASISPTDIPPEKAK
ncbi:MAG: rhodanese-like domain-containing protein [Candidatus Moraniibacteriota bacterium]|nr:MAG: rhodanese-like domain-containing protein [Candidatus Moranbacteria bacterium]